MASAVTPDSWIGAEVCGGRYRVMGQLGAGGMAYVYRAHDGKLESDVVLKVPRLAMLEDPTFVKRFRAEIRSLVKLRHPHVVSVLDVDEHDGVPFAVMQLLSGGTLLDLAAKKSAADNLAQMPEWLPDVAKAIDFLHRQGYVHRDIKPENILFDEHRHAYLSDFGVVKTVLASEQRAQSQALTQNGVLGTPEYMAPEMIMGQEFDGKADQYALGVTVYELLAKRRPFEADTGTAVLVAHTRDEPPRLDSLVSGLPETLVHAVHKAISRNPNDRFANCSEMANAISEGVALADGVRQAESRSDTAHAHTAETVAGTAPVSPVAARADQLGNVYLGLAAAVLVAGIMLPMWGVIALCIIVDVLLRKNPDMTSNYNVIGFLAPGEPGPLWFGKLVGSLGVKASHTQWAITFVVLVFLFKLLVREMGLSSWLSL